MSHRWVGCETWNFEVFFWMMLIPSFGAYSLADDNITSLKHTISPKDGWVVWHFSPPISFQARSFAMALKEVGTDGWPTNPAAGSSNELHGALHTTNYPRATAAGIGKFKKIFIMGSCWNDEVRSSWLIVIITMRIWDWNLINKQLDIIHCQPAVNVSFHISDKPHHSIHYSSTNERDIQKKVIHSSIVKINILRA